MTLARRGFSLVHRPPLWRGLAGSIVVLVAIELFARFGPFSEMVLPPVSSVLVRMFALLVDPEFLSALATTAASSVVALAVSTAIAVPLGVWLGSVKTANRLLSPLLELLRPMPQVALIPLGIIVLGLGPSLQFSMGLIAGVWPILFNTIYGIQGVDPVVKDTSRAFGVTGVKMLWRVSLPWSAPFIGVGIRVASSSVLIVIVATELLAGANDGLGSFILAASSSTRVDAAFAAIAYTGLLGLLFNFVLETASKKWLGWRSQ